MIAATAIPAPLLPLNSIDATLANVGGKGANLAILARAGFAVPAGFFVPTTAYRAFVAANRRTYGINNDGFCHTTCSSCFGLDLR